MTVTLVNAERLPDTGVYHHVAIGAGTRLVCVAGQVAWDAAGRTVGDDLADQVERAYLNVALALDAAGATVDDVVKLTIYVVDWAPERMPELLRGVDRARSALGTTAAPPVTLVGVAALDVPEHLVEIEGMAVLD